MPHTVRLSISSGQGNLMKTYHNEANTSHTCHQLQFNRKNSLHPLEAKRVQLLCISSHIENGFLFERENSE